MKNRRRNYFINKKYQFKFIAAFIGISLAGIAATVFSMVHFITAGIEANLYRSHLKITHTDQILIPVIVKVNLLFFLLGALVVSLLSYYYSRKLGRLVGGLTEGFRALREGRLGTGFTLGASEEFPELERQLGRMVEETGARVEKMRAVCRRGAARLTGEDDGPQS